MKANKNHICITILVMAVLALVAANLYWGAVSIPADEVTAILLGSDSSDSGWNFIVWESRVPQCITALLCGAALAVSGLILHQMFRTFQYKLVVYLFPLIAHALPLD